ncbi:uncharacterized protein LOC135498942 [Lineus longissimus]|uniref:uncharacterized protein LOC135498942 n=1 Tax=Lineus longissimus TaxID=88925 RepID=UPI002B4FACDA
MAASGYGMKRTASQSFDPCSGDGGSPVAQRQRLKDEERDRDSPPKDQSPRKRHPKDDFFWVISYQERAFLTKLLVESKQLKPTSAPAFDASATPKQVKFLTRLPDQDQAQLPPPVCTTFDFRVKLFDIKLTAFELQVKRACGDAFNFELTVDDKDWDNIFSIIKETDYTLSSNGWRSTNPGILPSRYKDTPKHLYSMAHSLDRALFVNMGNGEAKKFIDHLLKSIQILANVPDSDIVYHESPVNNSYTNGKVQLVDVNDDLTWDDDDPNSLELRRSRSRAASTLSDSADSVICDSQVHRKVPDHIWYLHEYPGYFVLNVECKPFHSYSARVQCIHQMLTQMHFQNSAFGLLISKQAWTLIFIRKSGEALVMNEITEDFEDSDQKFIVENLKLLCSWLYRILDYRMKCQAG